MHPELERTLVAINAAIEGMIHSELVDSIEELIQIVGLAFARHLNTQRSAVRQSGAVQGEGNNSRQSRAPTSVSPFHFPLPIADNTSILRGTL